MGVPQQAVTEIAGLEALHLVRALREDQIACRDAREYIAGAPELSWHVRQWHQPASHGALFSS